MSEAEDAELQRAIRLSAAEYRRQQQHSPGRREGPSSSAPPSSQLRAAGQSVLAGEIIGVAGPALRVGDLVRARPGLDRPLHGWGPVDPYDVGTITAVIPGSPITCAVSFGAKTDPLGDHGWMCALADLVRATGNSSSSSSSASSSSASSSSASPAYTPSTVATPFFNGKAVDTSGDRALAAMLSEQQKIELQIQRQRQQRQQQQQQQHRQQHHQHVGSRPSLLQQQSITSIPLHQKRFQDEQEASASLSRIVASCMQNNAVFLDPEFPTTVDSLYGHRFQELESKGKTSVRKFGRATHARSTHGLQNTNWVVFRGPTPAPEDIQQGALGDCYFLSALACLVQRPELVKRLFVGPTAADLTNTTSQHGCYQINLCKDGKWQVYTIDDMLPFHDSGCLAYTSGARMQLWPSLLEKAFAKAHGSYGAIVSGQCSEALSILTGSPTDSFRLSAPSSTNGTSAHPLSMDNFRGTIADTDMLWINLESYQAAGFVMACACHVRSGDSADRYKEIGLQSTHAYSLLQVKAVRVSGGGSGAAQLVRLVQLRNPWGRFGWKGEWGAASEAWNRYPHVRQELGYYATSDAECGGVFWMEVQDFQNHFTRLDVCRVRESSQSWSEVRLRAPLRNTNLGRPATMATVPAFRLELFDSTSVEFCLHQTSRRGIGAGAGLDPASFGLIIVHDARGGGTGGGGAAGQERVVRYAASSSVRASPYVRCDAQLPAGNYLCVPVCFNAKHSGADAMVTPRRNSAETRAAFQLRTSSMTSSLVLAIHSAKPVIASEIRVTPRDAALAIISRVKREGKIGRGSDSNTRVYSLTDSAGAYVCVDVAGGNTACQFSLDLNGSAGLVSSRMSLTTTDVIPARHVQLVQIATSLSSSGWAYRSSMQWSRNHATERHEPGVFSPGLHEPVASHLVG